MSTHPEPKKSRKRKNDDPDRDNNHNTNGKDKDTEKVSKSQMMQSINTRLKKLNIPFPTDVPNNTNNYRYYREVLDKCA